MTEDGWRDGAAETAEDGWRDSAAEMEEGAKVTLATSKMCT